VAVVGAAGPTPRAGTRPVVSRWPSWLFGPWLATLALVVVVVGLAAWGFDRLFSLPAAPPPAPNGVATGSPSPGGATGPAADDAAPAATGSEVAPPTGPAGDDAVVRIEVVTDPPGAEITIDGFPLPGRTPLLDVPVTARAGRVVRAELDGFEPLEARYDLLFDGRVELTLVPLAAAAGGVAVDEVAEGRVALTITDPTWLEVYRSGARNEGERLVFTTAQPGASYEFELPVYVYVGNAAGARVNLAGQDLGPMGAPGAVLGRAFGR
jgi:hypothetical protein